MDTRWGWVFALLTAAFVVVASLAIAPNPASGAPGGVKGKPVIEQEEQDADKTTTAWGKGGKPKDTTTTTTTASPTTTTTSTTTTTPTTTTLPTTTTTTSTTTTTPTTTTLPTTTTTTSTTTTTPTTTTLPATTTTTLPPEEPTAWVSPEGVQINIDSTGEWTPEQIHGLLLDSALDLDVIGRSLTINVQDVNPSATTTSASTSGGAYTNFSATISLKGVSSSFASLPDAIVAHEYGHVWTEYHRFISQQGDWSAWLDYRGLTDDPRVDSTYPWSKLEMIAEDYRLLFSSPTALAQWPNPMNSEITDPRDVPGLRDFFLNDWAT